MPLVYWIWFVVCVVAVNELTILPKPTYIRFVTFFTAVVVLSENYKQQGFN